MIHKSPACKNPRLSIFGYLWQWWTFYQWHLPSCPKFFLSTGAFSPSTFDPISCPSIDVSSLSFRQRPVEEQWNIMRHVFVWFLCKVVWLDAISAGLFDRLQAVVCRRQTRWVWAQGSLLLASLARMTWCYEGFVSKQPVGRRENQPPLSLM